MTKERRHRLLVGLVGMIALVVGSVMVVIFLNWSKYLIGPHQDPFTELYFEDHLKLPRKIEIGVPFKTTF